MRLSNAENYRVVVVGNETCDRVLRVEPRFVKDSESLTEASCTATRFAFLSHKGTLDTT
jgi:hypothetical protein